MPIGLPALRRPARSLVLLLLMLVATMPAIAEPLSFAVTYDASITDSFTGRVYVMLSTSERREPRFGPSWSNTEPFFAVDVTDWRPGTRLIVDDAALSFPAPPSTLAEKQWSIQAVMRRNPDSPRIGTGAGSAYGRPIRRTVGGTDGGVVELAVDRVVDAASPRPRRGVEVVSIHSTLLTAFHDRDQSLNAAVILPDGYDPDGTTEYPALYIIPGFGGDHLQAVGLGAMARRLPGGDQIVMIGLDPSCWSGHHVFADSANNGPCARALIEELIPELERRFRLRAAPSGRFLTGASSGGWSSLWLQVTAPDVFGGTWSLCPDPVDFTDFQQIDLYAPGANMYVDEHGARRPIGRQNGVPMMWYDEFSRMEVVAGPGGQLFSFEAVFSPRDEHGQPRRLYDRTTGAVDPAVAETWKAYDIRHRLETNWPALAPKLAGRLHVFVGSEDNFYLDGAVRSLKAVLERLGSDAVIEIQPGLDHGTVVQPNLQRIIEGVRERFEAATPATTG
ncbi:MAG: hypothetical protein KDA25_04100 [Phycisphaerales bacterium]|nr:hypothetical protein [Phycisphaerales bacterium]